MAKDESTKAIAAASAAASPATDEADAEGHSMGLLLGANALSQSRTAASNTKKTADEQLPPLSKPWPNMRDDKKA